MNCTALQSKSISFGRIFSEAEAAGVLAALDGMNEEQKRELLVFLDGVAFGQRLAENGPAA